MKIYNNAWVCKPTQVSKDKYEKNSPWLIVHYKVYFCFMHMQNTRENKSSRWNGEKKLNFERDSCHNNICILLYQVKLKFSITYPCWGTLPIQLFCGYVVKIIFNLHAVSKDNTGSNIQQTTCIL
jgi:hypothetical protein